MIAATVHSNAPARIAARQTFVMSGVSWNKYLQFLDLFSDYPGHRLTYDRGTLEIMSPSLAHDDDSRFLGDLVRVAARVLKLPTRRGGSTTMRDKLVEKGIEPDDCFWIQNAALMAGRRKLDLETDPPPDLGVEVDVTSSSLDRMEIYAAFRVGELWRLEDDVLTFHVLQPDGTYAVSPVSKVLPSLTPEDFLQFLLEGREAVDQGELLDTFRTWLQNKLHGSSAGPDATGTSTDQPSE